jgi:hypothetical protein
MTRHHSLTLNDLVNHDERPLDTEPIPDEIPRSRFICRELVMIFVVRVCGVCFWPISRSFV